ncbi:1-acyl-sn-glycerol-3-phosphate acyltransferase [Clostridium algifaecis]|uniref:1-acyl-sn-glycerol-3-phosphate acyltransferase n=1 Tax=Clostridium algifaecis TaxID=1472040 RepID=A0ABS4KVV5_9CLOT|nr:lysophospholipid acyltransferase family protein [Clostridium algifaecis]MBP2034159.1 1-acyl-sn-glycerol-3-phosphate acyltransferase [Clostridium algifaecis]
MIKNILFYVIFFFYMLYSLSKKIKLDKIKKTGTKEEIESYINDCVTQWSNFTLKLTGARIHIKGNENIPDGACLFVANHQGFLDIPIIISSLKKPVGFIAKKEIQKVKIISYWMKQINCVFMDRSNIRNSVKSINQGIEILKSGYSMVIFPEGTRSKGPKIGEFKKGSLKLGLKAMVPIVPIAIDGSYKLREGNKHSNIKPADVNITICKPIYTDKLSREQKETLSEIIKSEISKNIYLKN